MKSATLILPNQIFEKHEILNKSRPIYLCEHPTFFTKFTYHKQKLILHRASLKHYYDFLVDAGFEVYYLEFDQNLFARLAKDTIKAIHLADIADNNLALEFNQNAKKHSIKIIYYDSPIFLNTLDLIENDFDPQADHYFMTSFYIKQRKRLNILLEHGKPIGGKWSFDPENRQKLPAQIEKIPKIWIPKKNNYVTEAINYVEHNFKDNYGNVDTFIYPINFDDANAWFENFLENRLANFGAYEDAMDSKNPFLFHSLLSPLLNTGLLNPMDIITRTLEFSKYNTIPLNSLEGFIRQIIGWREYVRSIYTIKGEFQRNANFFNNGNKLPESFWTGETGIEILDQLIIQLQDTAYSHHIERLMVFGNFMLLCSIDPNDSYKWFMENFIDAYDWVMVPNVYGMSQFSDGGLMVTKPYISSSNYILKMSNFKKGSWCEIWDALYWNFIYQNQTTIAQIPRLKVMISYLKKIDNQKLKMHISRANKFLDTFLSP